MLPHPEIRDLVKASKLHWKKAAPLHLLNAQQGLMLVDRGSATISHEITTYSLTEGDLVLLPSGQSLYLKEIPSSGFDAIILQWNANHYLTSPFTDIFKKALNEEDLRVKGTSEELESARLIVRALFEEMKLERHGTEKIIPILWQGLIEVVHRQMENRLVKPSSTDRPVLQARLQKILEHLNRNLSSDPDWDALARESGFSPLYFRKFFRKTMGSSPDRYLQITRIRKAEKLLQTTRLQTSEICYEVGFKSISVFNSTFRKIIGAQPSYISQSGLDGLSLADQEANFRHSKREETQALWQEPYARASMASARDWRPLDLTPYFNRPVREAQTGLFGPPLHLSYLISGRQQIHGVPFELPLENKKQANTCLVMRSSTLRGSKGLPMPGRVEIPLPAKLAALYILHACAWAKDTKPFASYTLKYEKGQRHHVPISSLGVSQPVEYEKRSPLPRLQDWWSTYRHFASENARPVLIQNPKEPKDFRILYTTEITNPDPGRKLEALEIESDHRQVATLALFAITLQI